MKVDVTRPRTKKLYAETRSQSTTSDQVWVIPKAPSETVMGFVNGMVRVMHISSGG